MKFVVVLRLLKVKSGLARCFFFQWSGSTHSDALIIGLILVHCLDSRHLVLSLVCHSLGSYSGCLLCLTLLCHTFILSKLCVLTQWAVKSLTLFQINSCLPVRVGALGPSLNQKEQRLKHRGRPKGLIFSLVS